MFKTAQKSRFQRGNSFRKRSFSGGGSSGGGSRGRFGRGRGPRIDVSRFINKSPVVEQKTEVYVSQHTFADFAIDERLKKNIAVKGYTQTTPIQDKAIKPVLEGKDVVGIANTGTGKTAAFLIPLIHKVLQDRNQKVLIIAPTRELALQIQEELYYFSKSLNLFSVLCIGGESISFQIRQLRRVSNFVIGTPGRLKDLIERKCLNLGGFQNIVLDEADRMVDMGFINDIKFLLGLMPKERQSLFFSATISSEVRTLISGFLKEPVTISVKTRDTAANVDQDVVRVSKHEKITKLTELLRQEDFQKVLVFGRTKHGVERLSVDLGKLGFKVASIHGDKSQYKRQAALNSFKKNFINILVATDVAARGLDIPNVSHVINYDVPDTYEDYVHRIGRTGRADKKGKALTFVE